MRIELTKDEVQAMVAMLDMAVKAQGLRVAETAVALLRKLDAATDDQPHSDAPTSDKPADT